MTAHEQASEWIHKLASRGVTLNQHEMREMFEKPLRDRDALLKAAQDIAIHLNERTHPEGNARLVSYVDGVVCSVRSFDALNVAIAALSQQKGNHVMRKKP